MTEKNNIARPDNPAVPLYASVEGMAAPLSGDECIFLAGAEGKSHPMTLDVLQAMDQCRNFQSEAAHIDAIATRLPALGAHRDVIAKVMQFLINRELLVSADSMLSQISAQAEQQLLPPLSTVFIFTDSRPQSLERLVSSIIQYQSRYGHDLRYTVVDQSRSREMVQRNAAILSSLGAAGIELDHLDREWQRRLIEHLGNASDCSTEMVQYALAGPDGNGASLNLALLLCAGGRFMLIEDQFSLAAMQRQGASTGLDLRPRPGEPLTLALNNEVLHSTLRPFEGDPLALSIESCGTSLGTLMANQGLAGELTGLPHATLEELTHGSRVLTTSLGSWGDSRYQDSQWLYRISPDALTTVAPDREAYYEFLRRPSLAQGFAQAQISRVGRSAPGIIDNRQLLPPASVGSHDDRFAFQSWLHFVYPRSVALNTPTLLEYRLQLEAPTQATPLPPSAARFLGELALVRMEDCAAVHAPDRFDYLSRVYQDLAAASGQRLQNTLRQFIVHTSSDRIRQIQDAMDASERSPEFWRADAKDWLEFEVGQFSGNAAPVLAGWSEALDADQCAEQLRQTAASSAQLLREWPSLWNACHGHFEELVKL